MSSYNLLNGIHTSEHKGLCSDILRREWGYEGILMTDWVVSANMIAKDCIYGSPDPAKVAACGHSLYMPGSKKDYEAEYGEKPLGEFVREIVGLDMTAAKAAFAEYLNDVNLDADQIYFVNQIIEYIVRNGVMKDMSVLQEAPFTDRGSIVEVFTDISVWLGIRRVIDKINANAAA